MNLNSSPGNLLKIDALSVCFGGLVALNAFALEMAHGSLLGLIGPNGAGKTTVFNLITGVYRASGGSIALEGADILRHSPQQRARLGIARTFQNIRLFTGLSVFDNLMAAVAHERTTGSFASILGLPAERRKEEAYRKRVAELLEFVGLSHVAHHEATSLPYGDQRKLEIARALMRAPKLLLLDEPAAGMNPTEKDALGTLVKGIAASGIGILLIEHDMKFVMNLCQTITVLDHGEIIARGSPAAVQKNPQVIEAYLGVGHAEVNT